MTRLARRVEVGDDRAMRRLVAVSVLAFCLLAPAAQADGFDTLQRLAKQHLRPAPLIPATAPRPLSDLAATLTLLPARGKRGYGVRLVHYTSYGPDAVIALERGVYRSMRAARRDHPGRVRHARVRGRRALVITHRGYTSILWREDKSVYTLESGTPRKVSLRGLKATAKGLRHLGANYLGSFFAQGTGNTSFDATLVTVDGFVSGVVEWGTDNCTFNGLPSAAHGGSATFMLLPLRGGAFSIPLNGPLASPAGWSGAITGTASPSAIDLTIQGSGTFDGEACDTGPMSVSAERRDPL
jgi:hypothetical protein